MSDNNKSTDMIDAVLAGLPKEDGDNDVAMTGGPNDDLEPGQIPPWEDVRVVHSTTRAANPAGSKSTPARMTDVQSTAQAAKSVDNKSTPTPTGVSASPKPPSAQGGRSMSTALSVSSTPHSDRAQPLPASATPNRRESNLSGIFSFNGSPNTTVAANTGIGRPMGALVLRPSPTTTPNSPRGIPRGPTKQSPSRRGQGVGPGLPQAPKGPGQNIGFGCQGPNRPSQGVSHGLAQVPNHPSQGGGSGLSQAAARPGQGAGPRPFDASGHRIPAVGVPNPDPNYSGPTPTALLSRECQRRHFNPEWNVYQTGQGRFGCDVRVGTTWIRGKTTWRDTVTAKYAMAKEALPVVKRIPVVSTWTEVAPPQIHSTQMNIVKQEPGAANHTRATARSAAHTIKKEDNISNNTSRAQTAVKQQPGHALYTPPSRREQSGNQGTKATMLSNISVDGSMMTHLQHFLGVSIPPNSSPEVTKAFLEGVALGSRLGASLDGVTRDRRGNSRSRSPAASRRVDRYRARSPPPNARIRTTPPPAYADFLGRPNSDHYRPADSAVPRERPRVVVAQQPARSPPVGNTGINSEWWGHDGYYRMNRIKSESLD